MAANLDGMTSMIGLSGLASQQGRHRTAAKQAEKAITKEPENPRGHYALGIAYLNSGEIDNSSGPFLRAMELSDAHTAEHDNNGDALWAEAAALAYSSLSSALSSVTKPEWFIDVDELQAVAARAVTATPHCINVLDMQRKVYESLPEQTTDIVEKQLSLLRRISKLEMEATRKEHFLRKVHFLELTLQLIESLIESPKLEETFAEKFPASALSQPFNAKVAAEKVVQGMLANLGEKWAAEKVVQGKAVSRAGQDRS